MKEFRRHPKHARRVQLMQLGVGRIMFGIDAARLCPRMQHVALLRIVLAELAVERRVPASFVAVVPEQNGRMIYVPLHEFTNQFLADASIVALLPSGQFIEHI